MRSVALQKTCVATHAKGPLRVRCFATAPSRVQRARPGAALLPCVVSPRAPPVSNCCCACGARRSGSVSDTTCMTRQRGRSAVRRFAPAAAAQRTAVTAGEAHPRKGSPRGPCSAGGARARRSAAAASHFAQEAPRTRQEAAARRGAARNGRRSTASSPVVAPQPRQHRAVVRRCGGAARQVLGRGHCDSAAARPGVVLQRGAARGKARRLSGLGSCSCRRRAPATQQQRSAARDAALPGPDGGQRSHGAVRERLRSASRTTVAAGRPTCAGKARHGLTDRSVRRRGARARRSAAAALTRVHKRRPARESVEARRGAARNGPKGVDSFAVPPRRACTAAQGVASRCSSAALRATGAVRATARRQRRGKEARRGAARRAAGPAGVS